MAPIESKFYVAIDPWALILPNDIYVKLNAPRPQEVDVVKAVKAATAAEHTEALARVRMLKAHLAVVEKALEREG